METESTSGPDNPRLRQSSDSCCVSSDSLDGAGITGSDHRERIGDMNHPQLVGDARPGAGGGGVCALAVEARNGAGVSGNHAGKRRRGRPPRNHFKAAPVARPPQRMKEDEEDVCFICFDGGNLVLCDRRGCPKAYHPACIKRDESFFRSKAKWNCGWHICSVCQKPSHYMCYTCTYSLCKGCTKGADYVCVRGSKGFCGTCMKTIMLIENIASGNMDGVHVDFDDQTSWEYLFKVYWILLKEKLSLTVDELIKARNPSKRATKTRNGLSVELSNVINAQVYNLETPNGDLALSNSKRRKIALQQDLSNSKDSLGIDKSDVGMLPSSNVTNWATKELLEFVAHMKGGNTPVLARFDVQTLLLEYIARNNLSDPCQKSQIMCDARLINLFGKARLGHFEMRELLESHFLNQGSQSGVISTGVVDNVSSQLAINGSNSGQLIMMTDKSSKTQKTADDKGQQKDPDEYAAIDFHNVNLLFLKRHLIERLLDDANKLHEKVVGCFIRKRVTGTEQKGDFYRLLPVVGTSKATDSHKVGMRMANVMLEINNLGKKEVVSIDGVSNQEFTEDECSKLRQEIQSGLMKQPLIGEVQVKAMQLQAVRVDDWLESEISQLNHLRDRASESGHRKEHRECVEKLQLLNSPAERQRRLSEVPEVHADPTRNSSYGSEEDAGMMNEKSKDELGRLAEGKEMTHAHDEVHISSETRNREDSAQSHSASNKPSLTDSEADKIWLYQDPYGKTQGPFSMMILRRWSTNGNFPPHLMIWRITEKPENSILLTDALKGHFLEQPKSFHNSSLPSRDVTIGSGDGVMDEHTLGGGEMNAGQGVCENVEGRWNLLHNDPSGPSTGNNDLGSQSSSMSTNVKFDQVQTRNLVQKWDLLKGDKHVPSPPQVSSTLSSSAFSGKPCEALAHQPTEGQGFEGWDSSLTIVQENLINVLEEKYSVGQEKEGIPDRQSCLVSLANTLETSESPVSIGFPDLPSTILHSSKEHLKFQVDINEKPVSSDIHVQDSGPCGSTTSSLVGGSLAPEVAGNQGGCSPTPSKASPEEWGSNIIPDSSTKPSELASDHVATPYSGSCLMMQPSPTHPAANPSDWGAIVADPDDFSSLVDESVSDLLAEVEAMEALYGLASHYSTMHSSADLTQGSEHECFSPALSSGIGKSNALNCNTDLQMPSQSTGINQPFVASPAEALESQRHSAGNSSTSDNRPSNVSVNQFENVSNVKPSPLPPTSWCMASTDPTWPTGSETTSVSCGAVQGYEQFYPGGLSLVPANPGWPADHGTADVNTRMYPGNYAGNSGYWPSQTKHPGTRECDFRSRDSSLSRNRPLSNRQSYAGANGVHSFRTPPKGQRVCKLYESGYCKKGATCSFWHP